MTISALVFDAANNPLPGVSVLFRPGSLPERDDRFVGLERHRAHAVDHHSNSNVSALAGAAKGDTTVLVSSAPSVTIDNDGAAIVGVPEAITVTTATGAGNSSPRQVQTLTIDFGDGTVDTRSNVTGPAAFIHTYQRAGGFTITARAVDVSGNTGVASKAIIVSRSLPTPVLTIAPNPADKNQIVAFGVTTTPAAGTPPVKC